MKKNNKEYKETFIFSVLIILMLFEVPYFNIFLISGLLLAIYNVVIKKQKLFLNFESVVLAMFIIFYFVFGTQLKQSTSYKAWYVISTLTLYACGYQIEFAALSKEDRTKKVEYIIHFISATYIIYILLTMIYSLVKGQFIISRNPLNIWTGTMRVATHYGTMSIIPLVDGIWLMFLGDKKRKLLGFGMVLFLFFVGLITASRTVIFLIPLSYFWLYFSLIAMQGDFKKKHLQQIIIIVFCFIVGYILYQNDILGIKSFFYNTQLGQRYQAGKASSLFEDSRWKYITFLGSHIKDSLWGGGYTRLNEGMVHNAYLNVFDLSGVIPFLLLIIFSVCVLGDFRRLRRRDSVEVSAQALLMLLLIVTFIQMQFEPTFESVPAYMWCFFMLCGMQRQLSFMSN